jgi:2-polyprenyl-3-methyl-5-hydroxy-6-metoxy-1,4-benzoquinol methylase
MPVYQRELVDFLKRQNVSSGFLDQLKVNYRPLICPLDELINNIGKAESVFDVGCGSGQFALLIAEFSNVKRIGGVEIDERLVNNARKLLAPYSSKVQVDFSVYDGSNLPASIHTYDLIFLVDVLHHIPKKFQEGFIAMIYSLMRPGARFVLKDIDASSPFVYSNKMHDMIFAREIGNEWTYDRAMKVTRDIGFKIVSSSKRRMYVYPHYTITLEK